MSTSMHRGLTFLSQTKTGNFSTKGAGVGHMMISHATRNHLADALLHRLTGHKRHRHGGGGYNDIYTSSGQTPWYTSVGGEGVRPKRRMTLRFLR